jgi:signal transduction histidine kinase
MSQAPLHPTPGDVYHGDPAGQLADALSQGVLLARDGCVVWANRFLRGLAGGADAADDPEALAGVKLDDLFEDSGRGLPRGEGPGQVDCWLLRPGTERREVLCHRLGATPGDPSVLWVIEDVTHLRRLERELHRMGRELAEANRECERLRESLRCERGEREELLSVVSHELRTPVTVIRGYSRLLLSEEVGPLTQAQRRFLEESRESCERLNRFIERLIDASRADKGAHVLELGHGPVAPVLASVVSLFRPLLEEQEMTAVVTAEGSARFDRLRLEQILTNLVANAIKFGHHGGNIELRAGPADSEPRFLELVVCDDGPGVAPEDRERIFEPYAQAGEKSGGGLGLGLAICRRLVEAHGGRIRVSERPGGGASFVFTLPCDAAAEA